MKRKVLIAITSALCVICCALGLTACGMFGGDGGKKEQYAVYHLNGGYIGSDPEDTEDYSYYLSPDSSGTFSPLKAKKQTWLLENWYFDEELTEVYSDSRFEELRARQDNVDLYAKWTDEVIVTKDNFKEFFKVTSGWNGGGSIGNAGVKYSISPVMTFDPLNSAESFEVEINPVLTLNNSVVWDGGKSTVALTSGNDYSCSGVKAVDSSGAGVRFDIFGRTLDYKLLTQSFRMKLLHNIPIDVTLDLDGGECESDKLTVNGCELLEKESLPTPQKSGYKFMGWFTDADFTEEYADWTVTRPITLYAKFAKQITVTYHMNGAEEKQPETYLTTDYIAPGTPVRDNYKFFGYYTTPDFKEDSKFTPEAALNAGENDIDLYARWEALRTITFNTNGGSAKAPIQVADTEVPNLGADPYKSGLEFSGWYTDAEYTQKYDESAPVSGDITLYALWVQERSISQVGIDGLKEYIDIELKNEKIDGALTLTLTITIKEKYRKYGFVLMGDWSVDLSDESGANLGNGTFGGRNAMTLSTYADKFTATGVYTAEVYTSNNNATVFNLNVNISYGIVNIPEGGFENR